MSHTHVINLLILLFFAPAISAQIPENPEEQSKTAKRNTVYICPQPEISGLSACEDENFHLRADGNADNYIWWVENTTGWQKAGEGNHLELSNTGNSQNIKLQAVCPYTPEDKHRLITDYIGDSGKEGMMFQMVAKNDITIQGFDLNMREKSENMHIYYHKGAYNYSINNPDAWIKHEQKSVEGNGKNIPTHVSINDIKLENGDTIGLYISFETDGLMYYDNGDMEYADENIRIENAKGVGWPFINVCGDRVFNGAVYYATGDKPRSEPGYEVTESINNPPKPSIWLSDDYLTTDAMHDVQWYFEDAPLSGENSMIHYPQESGAYFLQSSNRGCLSEPSNMLHYEQTNITGRSVLEGVTLYPNPVDQKARLKFNNPVGKPVRLSVYSLSGKLIRETIQNPGNASGIMLSFASLPAGHYHLLLNAGEQEKTIPFIKK
ncbi:MAG: T9SS type A sorting domain-containing protein [Bacteroidales bacterium]